MRNAYIAAQKRDHCRQAVAVLPVHYPKEILTAHGLLAVELWGPPGPPRGPDVGRVQTYVCSLVRNAMAFLGAGGADAVDAVLFPHTCDSIQGLATLAPDFGAWGKASFRFQHPKGEDRASARAFLEAELRQLAEQLEDLSGRSLTRADLQAAVALHAEIDQMRGELLDRRAHLPHTDTALYDLLRRGEYLWPEDHLTELRQALAELRPEPVQTGIPVLVTGYVPEPVAIFTVLNGAGAFVVADDYAAVGRRVVRWPRDPAAEPFAQLVELHFHSPPCPTRGSDQRRRIAHLCHMVKTSGAAGLLIHEQKFCEPELFDVPAIRKAMVEKELPLLYLEGELELELSGQTTTRLEAFVEMIAR